MDTGSSSAEDGLRRRSPPVPQAGETIIVSDYPSVPERLHKLGIADVPAVAILPRNFETAKSADELVFEANTADLRKLAKKAGVEISTFGIRDPKSIQEHDASSVGFVLLLGIQAFNSAGSLLEFINNITHYLKRVGIGRVTDQTEIIQELIVTNRSISKRLTYRGPLSGLPKLLEAGREAIDVRSETEE
jgi:hypothetical protein